MTRGRQALRGRLANTFQVGNPHTQLKVYHIHLQTFEDGLLGQMDGPIAQLNPVGQIAADEWLQAANNYRGIYLDRWSILPNGVRALVFVEDDMGIQSTKTYGQSRSQLKPRILSSFVAGFKAAAAKRINLVRSQPGAPVWQRGYHEQYVNDELTLDRIRQVLARTTGEI
jgi:putative transposase